MKYHILHDLCNRVSVVQQLVSLPVTQKIWVQFPAETLFWFLLCNYATVLSINIFIPIIVVVPIIQQLVRLFVAQKARVRIPIGTFLSVLIHQCRKNSFILFFFLYVRNAVAHCAAVSAGFTFFRLRPKVERSGLLFAFLFSFTTFYNVFFTFVTSNAFCLAHTPCAGPPILSQMCALTQPITHISWFPPFV